MLQDYIEQKNGLLEKYEKILSIKNFLPVNGITREDIELKRQHLKDEHFFVSFTGQIKAGKSTLINALLFGDDIIPADDTPHTAKITIIKYAKTPKIEVTFYNKDEWNELKSDKELYDEYIKPDVNRAISQGVFESEVIEKKAQIKEDGNFKNLMQYVAKDGKYTPFVNLVTIYYNSEMLKEITFVDTPGTNDPNKQRDRVAKEWIHKTNANIYISYAGQAMSQVDTDFIDQFLLGVPKNQKLTVFNKIDSISDESSLQGWIEELKKDEELGRREIFGDDDSIVMVSGLGALISKMDEKKIPLTKNMEYYADMLDEKGFLKDEKHHLSQLEKAIEHKLIKIKGENIISSHKKMIGSVFDKKITELQLKMDKSKDFLKDLFKDESELKKDIETNKQYQKKVKNDFELLRKFFDFKLVEENENLKTIIIANNTRIIRKTKEDISKINRTDNYKHEVLWIIKGAINANFETLKKNISGIRDDIISDVDRELQKFSSEYGDMEKSFNQSFSLSTLELNNKIENTIDKLITQENIQKIVIENANLWERFWNTNGGLSNIRSAIMSKINEIFDQVKKDIETFFNYELSQYIKKDTLGNIEININKLLQEKEKQLKIVYENIHAKAKIKNEETIKIDILGNELKELNKIKKEIMQYV